MLTLPLIYLYLDSVGVKMESWQYATIVGITAVERFNPEKWYNVADWEATRKCHLVALTIVFSSKNGTFPMPAGTGRLSGCSGLTDGKAALLSILVRSM